MARYDQADAREVRLTSPPVTIRGLVHQGSKEKRISFGAKCTSVCIGSGSTCLPAKVHSIGPATTISPYGCRTVWQA